MKFYQKHKYQIIPFLVLVPVMIVSAYFAYFTPVEKEKEAAVHTSINEQISASLEVDGQTYVATFSKNLNVYEFMKKLQNESDFNFESKDFGGALGYFVNKINDVENSKEKYWIYYINGEKAKIGVSSYIIQPNDIISWKYENDDDL